MGGIEIDLKDYEDPAPKNMDREVAEIETNAPEKGPSVAKGRKLPFRASVRVEGSKYKGRRASRADVELDPATLGLQDDEDDESIDSDIVLSPGPGDQDVADVGDAPLEDSGDDSLIESGGDNGDLEEDLEQSARRRQEELKADERAAVERLAKAEEEDLRRARAVQKQREMYDSAVDMRIKLEPLMSLARSFPSEDQRKESSAWNESEELKKAMSSTEGALASLCAQAEKVFMLSWQREEGDGNTTENAGGFTAWRNGILDKWGRKVNEAEGVVPKGGFKTIDTSVSAQMKASLASGKYIARTRRVRETMDLVGGLELEQGNHEMQYDDGELYRTLLRDIIESGDASGGGLRYAQLSKGGRIKKKRDTSFAKGKRLKYDVHEKLVGFLAPMPMPDPGPVDEIIASLFGRMGTVREDQVMLT